MKKYRIEFNASGFYAGAGVWETLDEFCGWETDNAQNAIKEAKEWWLDSNASVEDCYKVSEEQLNGYCWRASEEGLEDDYGFPVYKWEYENNEWED